RAPYSSFGEGLTLLADGSSLCHAAGTSASAARVTHAVTQLWAANPQLSYQQVTHVLKTTALNLNSPGWNSDTGFGLLNLPGAIDLAVATAPIPRPVLSDTLRPVFDTSANDGFLVERPAWFVEDVWDTIVDVATFPYKKAGEAAKYLTDKAGDGIRAG